MGILNMLKDNKVYTAHAYRFGDREKHSYIVGVYSLPEKALKEAELEEFNREGKYTCEVIELEIDSRIDEDPGCKFNYIKPLYEHI